MLPHVEIRVATEADAANCQRYVAELFNERLPVLFQQDITPTIEAQRAFIADIQQSPRSVALLAFASGQIVGMLDFHGFPESQRAHSGIFGMSVAREARRTGVGKQLLTALFDWASRNQIRRIELEVFSNNDRAIQFYEQASFVIEGRKTLAVAVGSDFVDILLMAKMLRA